MSKSVVIMVFLSYLSRIVGFVCVTIVSIYFQNPSLLWWYLLPACMGVGLKTEKDGADNER